ncbi:MULTISPECIES: MFS transporter [Flavobacterium]|jgi:FSR family fosmidomycin resistance protein-like MFS transporter|uniref:FSR family fosmidomycin resistance protein-like MFS transporter n=1 Tax=Flavobacterium lindanitolerans TaxID=428988 RepID=A0A497VDF1_9FLAO|nr:MULTISPECIES: MFS transporter [Flavobacterium]MBU7569859.1 MFS transporter [Flavobacterium sp.]PZO26992.1 MAG: MFS transporter [Flavobacteriaceae bacterium]MDQ7961075.1 MFS transporter [Flavobacterium lindanitolerans]OJX54457.1 MAG: MFS transporter [Flavobacterium sp. 38-13]PKW29766.1 FSR family fosmidomycin resistance protein-like MFS transporter [Flavobacterium lindanitolerans]
MKATDLNFQAQDNKEVAQKTVYSILFSIAFAHMLNDLLQAVIPSVYPILKESYKLSFTQIGLITFAYQMAASILQPFVGFYTDKKPQPYSQIYGMLFTLSGIILLSYASNFYVIILSVILVGIGSSIFHPEASRISFLASGGKRGLAQSVFQLGGNAGTAIGPLLVALLVVPNSQRYILFFVIIATLALLVLGRIARWYDNHLTLRAKKKIEVILPDLSKNRIVLTVIILLVLIFSKFFYMASMSSYFTFYLIEKFNVSVQDAQFHLFLFLASCALGTLLGGPLGDKFGRKYVIWFSVLGAAPFALFLPYADLFWTGILSVVIGIIISSAFPAILVYAQELLPKKLGMVSGLFYGFAFGMGGLGSALLGYTADHIGIEAVYKICAYLPLIGIIALFLPNLKKKK